MKVNSIICLTVCVLALLCSSCREEFEIRPPQVIDVTLPEYTSIDGFYVLNEGNKGMNKATLDYYDYKEGTYTRNIFGYANPTVVKELGDVGNDIKIYGGKMYVVVNCSNKVDVLDARTVVKQAQINIPNCRYIRFHEGYAYVTSYAGKVEDGGKYRQRGYVAKIDTLTMEVVGRCDVGYQPDELEIAGDKIYVANSGGYLIGEYDNTVSVIDINTFVEVKRIEVMPNCHRLRVDRYGNLWVSSRGNYYEQASKLYCVDLRRDVVTDSLDIGVSNFHLDGDSLYICGTQFSYETMKTQINYGIVDVSKKEIVTRSFITDGTEKKIRIPYGITVNPITKDIYITDAVNYVSPGAVHFFDKEGKRKKNKAGEDIIIYAGQIPAHFVFLGEIKE